MYKYFRFRRQFPVVCRVVEVCLWARHVDYTDFGCFFTSSTKIEAQYESFVTLYCYLRQEVLRSVVFVCLLVRSLVSVFVTSLSSRSRRVERRRDKLGASAQRAQRRVRHTPKMFTQIYREKVTQLNYGEYNEGGCISGWRRLCPPSTFSSS